MTRTTKPSRLPRLQRLLAVLAAGALLASCAEPRQSPVEPITPTAPSALLGINLPLVPVVTGTVGTLLDQVIGPLGGVLKLPGGHSLTFPAGALPVATTIRAVQDGGVLKIEFGPEGLIFPDSALPTLTFSYAGTDLASGGGAPVVVYLDASGSVTEVLQTQVDPAAQAARARIRHFSTYALATD